MDYKLLFRVQQEAIDLTETMNKRIEIYHDSLGTEYLKSLHCIQEIVKIEKTEDLIDDNNVKIMGMALGMTIALRKIIGDDYHIKAMISKIRKTIFEIKKITNGNLTKSNSERQKMKTRMWKNVEMVKKKFEKYIFPTLTKNISNSS